MIKMIVTDIDGTIVFDRKVSEENKKTIKRLQENGYHVTLATGRHVGTALPIARQLGITLPIICSNGSIIFDPVKKKIVDVKYMNEHDLVKLLEICEQLDIQYLLYTDTEIIGTEKAKLQLDKIYKNVPVRVFDIDALDIELAKGIIKILVVEYDMKKLKKAANLIADITSVSGVISDIGLLNIGATGASKGSGLQFLTEYVNISIENVMAFGDQQNDISMIKVAGIGVAMCDGDEKLKEVANRIAYGDQRNAVSRMIREIVFDNKE